MTQKKSWNAAVCGDDWGWAVLSRDFIYHFHQKVHWEMFSLSAVSLCVAVCCAAPEVTDLPLCCVRASNLEKPHQNQFKGSTCPCHGWLHFALTGSPLLVILASSAPFSQSSSLHCPFPCYQRSHYSMSVDLWEKSAFFIYGHELLLPSWNKLGMSSVLNCEIA